ncbi:response regulator transcription factor [Brachybacterium vulturis]|uniref:response regulator transcription factor n=1 Tax=Brachybacterium vulturis TaxID=2017484 RepID=UPI003B848F0E
MDRRVAVVVEDDEDIRGLMVELLGQSGFTVHPTASGAAGVLAVRTHAPTVVTVDLGLPDFDGYEVIRRVRQFSDAYVVMLTARAEEIDTLLGLEAGADDYITKPFRPRELRARIEAMLRRPRGGGTPAVPEVATASVTTASSAPLAPADELAPALPSSPPPASAPWSAGAAHASAVPTPYADSAAQASAVPTPYTDSAASVAPDDATSHVRLELDGLALYPRLHRVEVAGREIALTPTEFLLLEVLLRGGQVVRSKTQLARTVRGDYPDGGTYVSRSDERTIEVHVGNLRRKLAEDPHEPRWLQTVRGVGYRMVGRPVVVG